MKDLYENAAKCVARILEEDYQLTASKAKQAIAESPLKSIFEKDAEIALHRSYKGWAKYIFEHWTKNSKE